MSNTWLQIKRLACGYVFGLMGSSLAISMIALVVLVIHSCNYGGF